MPAEQHAPRSSKPRDPKPQSSKPRSSKMRSSKPRRHAPTSRAAALELLLRIEEGGYSNLLVKSALSPQKMPDPAERALAERLVMGVTERRLTLDYITEKLSSRPLSKTDPRTRILLRLGIYQLAFCDRIPPHAAVNETVSAALPSSRGFVNAIMREYLRRTETSPFPLPEGGTPRDLSVRFSVSEALCRELISGYGDERARAILEAFLRPAPLTLRVNTLRTSRDALLEKLRGEGFDACPTTVSPWGIKIYGGGVPKEVSSERPSAFVEDEAAQLAARVLGARPGEKILDACAAPGTKSLSAAMEMEDQGEIVACELRENRLPLISRGAEAQGVDIIRPMRRDSAVPYEFSPGEPPFDRVLCDVPCSGYGTIRRKPEIRYRPPRETAELPELQLKILSASAKALRVGGTLVYSTCTLLPRENAQVIKKFLYDTPGFSAEAFTLPDGTYAPEGQLTLSPDMPPECDGFFIAKLVRNK